MGSVAIKMLLGMGRGSELRGDAAGDAEWWIAGAVSVVLVLFAGIMSGLTLGLMSLGLVDLEVLQQSGTPQEKKQASECLFAFMNPNFIKLKVAPSLIPHITVFELVSVHFISLI